MYFSLTFNLKSNIYTTKFKAGEKPYAALKYFGTTRTIGIF